MAQKENKMGVLPIPKLLMQLAIPAVIANLVNSVYNIVDQIFIGKGIGYLGNAATSIAFPLTTICLAFGLAFGIGGAANYNLSLGKKDPEKAKKVVGTASSVIFILGIIVAAYVIFNADQLLKVFGATENNFVYAKTYMSITAFGIPFLMFSTGVNPLVRADGNSKYSMICIIVGALINTVLDPVFIFIFNMGMAGAAYATVIGQVVSAIMLAVYYPRFQSVKLEIKDFIPSFTIIWIIVSLGLTSFIFQGSNVIIQIFTNNLLNIYGAQSVYGSDIPIAIAGIVTKLNAIFIAVIIGIVQGAQPIFGYNYGAKNYNRVLKTLKLTLIIALIVSTIAFIIFEVFPKPLIQLFGEGSEQYFQFGIKYVKVYLMFAILNGVQIASTTFFQAIGKAVTGAFLSLAKQILFLLPLLLIFPHFIGVDGVMYAAPTADALAFVVSITFLIWEVRKIRKMISVSPTLEPIK